MDFETGAKLTGSGFPLYKGKGAKLQRALVQYFLDFNTAAGYTEYLPPLMVNEASAYGTGQLPDKEGQMYYMPADNFLHDPYIRSTGDQYLPGYDAEGKPNSR